MLLLPVVTYCCLPTS